MNVIRPEMTPEIRVYYNALLAKNELTRSDVSVYPSFSHLTIPYRVVCRQRYYKAGVKQRTQFLKEIRIQEALQSRALDGVRVHREFCNPVISPPLPEEIVTLSKEEREELERILVKNGHIRRVVDDEVKSLVLELSGTNVATTYITCPIKARASLGIKLPFLVMVVKNMKKYFTFEIQIADDKDMRRRFRVSNFQSTTKVRPFCTTMPIGLSPGWNQIQFNLSDFTRRAYGSTYLETVRVQIHANVRIRRIYFSDRLYGDEEMPQEFKLFLPIPGTQRRQDSKRMSKEVEEKARPPISIDVDRIQLIEEEIPSVAPPASPVEPERSPDPKEVVEQPAAPEAPPPPPPPDEVPAEPSVSEAAPSDAAAGDEGEVAEAEGAEPPSEAGAGDEGDEGEGAAPPEELSPISEDTPAADNEPSSAVEADAEVTDATAESPTE